MKTRRTIPDRLQELGLELGDLVQRTGLDQRVVESIVAGRYTTGPRQRERIAEVLETDVDDIQWGRAVEVDPMYGHGPQFGRSP